MASSQSSQTLYVCRVSQNEDEHSFSGKLYTEKIEKMRLNSYRSNKHKDSGFDLFCPRKLICEAGKTTKIKMGVKCALYNTTNCGEVPMPYFMFPRSSISKIPLRLANNVGIIDSGYRGELMAVVDNISDKDYIIEQGQRLFQLCTGDLTPFYNVKLVDELDQTTRGEGGFGSTGM
tara:strand:+ start:1696 stop:2223 length:528 start_codon:yes stop_codon:yes gene_type:complete